MSDLYPLAQFAYQQWEGGEETGLRALELFRFKELTEATSGTAKEHDKYRYIKCRNACGSSTGDAAADAVLVDYKGACLVDCVHSCEEIRAVWLSLCDWCVRGSGELWQTIEDWQIKMTLRKKKQVAGQRD